MQPPAGGSAVEGVEEVLTGDLAELADDVVGGLEVHRKGVQPRFPRAGGAATEVRRHVLDHQRRHQVGALGGQAPRMQGTHRVPHHAHGLAQRTHRGGQVGHETLGADGMRIVDGAAAMPGGIVGVHGAQPGQPGQLTRPGGSPAHQAVDQHQWRALSATAGE